MANATTRKDLEAVIDRGEAVVYQGQHILSKDQLPSEADLRAAQGGVAPKPPTAAEKAAAEKAEAEKAAAEKAEAERRAAAEK